MIKEMLVRLKAKMMHGYLYGKFPGNIYRKPVNLYTQMNLLSLNWVERYYFMIGFNAGCFERKSKILAGTWYLIGGVYGPLPEGTTAIDWIGSERIVKINQRSL